MAALNQAWRRSMITVAVILSIFVATLFFFPSSVPDSLTKNIPFTGNSMDINAFHAELPEDYTPDLSHFPGIIKALYAPLILPVTARSFVDREGNKHKLKAEPRFTETMGKRLVLLDVDTRPLDKSGQLMSVNTPTWENLGHLSAGILSHYVYALIHGYDYKFIRASDFSDRQGGWTKVTMSHELLKSYDIVVTMDSDAVLTSPEVPMEWLMNLWNMTAETSILMAADPAGDPNFDTKGNVMLNTGFFFSQASAPQTEELYEAWATCPDRRDKFPGCDKWKYEGFREQTAFSENVRYAFDQETVIKTIPCGDANGYPEVKDSGCTGHFLRHFWMHKQLAKRQFSDGIMQAMTPQIHTLFKESVVDWRDRKMHGNIVEPAS